MSPQARETKTNINKWNYVKLQSFYTAKETINNTIRRPIEWENIYANDIFNKGLVSKIYKECINLTSEKQATHLKNG